MLTLDINNPREHCNLACEFCYSWDLEGQLSLSDIQRIVNENPQHDIIELGGGEPLLHPEISDIILYLTLERRKNVHVATNGTFIPESLYALPEQARNRAHMQVSLHASNEQLYEKITGKAHLFPRVAVNIPSFKDYFQTSVNTVAYQKNFRDIPDIVGLVKQYQVPHRINLALPIGRGKEVDLLTPEQIAEITSYLLAEKMNGTQVDSSLLHANSCPVVENAYGILKKGVCPAESGQKLYFSAQGISGCEFTPALIQLRTKGAHYA
ncbi:MAG: radical SAM protein [Nanoarchaeota archaeon]